MFDNKLRQTFPSPLFSAFRLIVLRCGKCAALSAEADVIFGNSTCCAASDPIYNIIFIL